MVIAIICLTSIYILNPTDSLIIYTLNSLSILSYIYLFWSCLFLLILLWFIPESLSFTLKNILVVYGQLAVNSLSFCLSVSFPTFNFNFFSSGSRIIAWWIFCSFQYLKVSFYYLLASMIFCWSQCSFIFFLQRWHFFSSGWYKYFLFIFGFQQLQSYWPSWGFLCFGFTELLEFLGWHL